MSNREERTEQRAEQIRKQEGISHGRNPENADPEMLEGEDAETVRANKAMKKGGAEQDETLPPFKPGGRFPPD